MGNRVRSLIAVPLIVGALTGVFAILGHLVVSAFGIPAHLHIPLAARVFGAVMLAFGFVFLGWLFRYWSLIEILKSTFETMRNARRGDPRHAASSRRGQLILQGPLRYVRHPIYFAVVVLVLGWWLLLDYTILLLMALMFFLWFTLVVIRFEEKELKARFGEEYEVYARSVPMFIPSLRSKWH
jgi:protein-S-isoprenylcysteine O-methyltransferase Ste14